MTITVDWANKLVLSDASITDAVAAHQRLRDLEDDPSGIIYPVTHTWRALDLGSGAYFYQLDLINGYQWKFPTAGNYTMNGNLNGTIVPVSGVYVERKTSAAYVTTEVGGSGPSAESIAAAVWERVIEGAVTAEQVQRILLAIAAGDATGLENGSPVFKSQDGSKDRVVATYSSGTRTIDSKDVS